jgi:hypothetical protein
MRPTRSILDASFRYVPAVATSVAATWRRAGWRPTTDEERRARNKPTLQLVVDWIGVPNVATIAVRRVSLRSGMRADTHGGDDCERSAGPASDAASIRKFSAA